MHIYDLVRMYTYDVIVHGRLRRKKGDEHCIFCSSSCHGNWLICDAFDQCFHCKCVGVSYCKATSEKVGFTWPTEASLELPTWSPNNVDSKRGAAENKGAEPDEKIPLQYDILIVADKAVMSSITKKRLQLPTWSARTVEDKTGAAKNKGTELLCIMERTLWCTSHGGLTSQEQVWRHHRLKGGANRAKHSSKS